MKTSLCIYTPWFPFSLRVLPPQEPTHVLTPFSPLLHSITRRLTLLQLPALLLMIIPLPINLLTPLATILGFLARRTLEQSLRAALRLLPIAHLTALAIGILVDHRATKLEDVFTEHRMLLALLPRVRRLDHFVQSARCLVENEVARHGGAAENILHRFVEAIGEVRIKPKDVTEGTPNEVPHVVDLVLAVGRRVVGLLQVGYHGQVLGEFSEQGLVIGCIPEPEVVRICW